MKTRWLPFTLSCLIVAFILGQYLGAGTQADRQLAQEVVRETAQTTIAVVNADTGINIDGDTQNFSSAIIETLGRILPLYPLPWRKTALRLGCMER